MFKPNHWCVIIRTSTETDVFGMPTGTTRTRERCTVVEYRRLVETSSVRADTSASRGNARELQVTAKFLLPTTTTANMNDLLEWDGDALRIVSKTPRYSVQGRLDHYEITCADWK